MLDTIDELRRTLGLGTLLISHGPGVIAHAAQQITVLNGGRIVEQGERRARQPGRDQSYPTCPALLPESHIHRSAGPETALWTLVATLGPA